MEGEKSVPWPFASDTLKSYHSLGSPKTSGSKPLKGGLNDFSEVSCITPDTQRLTVVKDLHHVHISTQCVVGSGTTTAVRKAECLWHPRDLMIYSSQVFLFGKEP